MRLSLWGGLATFLLFNISVQGQVNLVLNPSFEIHSDCGTFFWYNCSGSAIASWDSPTFGSPDWFDTCGNLGSYGMPQNYAGYQYPHGANAYGGFGIQNNPAGNEYVQGDLSTALLNGKMYCVTFYISLGDSQWYATSKLGAYLSPLAVCRPNTLNVLPYTPQVLNLSTNLLSDKINWVPVSGEFTAVGGEQFITIGSFDSVTPYTYVGNGGLAWNTPNLSYYYIDDVSVREITLAKAGRDTLICIGDKVLIGMDSAVAGVSYQWEPTTGLLNPNAAQTIASPTVTTTYTLTVVNDSMKGCNCADSVNSDTVTIHVCPLENNIFIPDAFSPNGDGQNDVLFAKGNNVNIFYMAIYDRWGNRVFESESESVGWDGTYKSKPEETGTYVYYANGTYTDGSSFNKKGNITLVR